MDNSLWILFLEQLGEHKISRSESELYRHSRDESSHLYVEPDFVVFPENVEDVVKVLQLANEIGYRRYSIWSRVRFRRSINSY